MTTREARGGNDKEETIQESKEASKRHRAVKRKRGAREEQGEKTIAARSEGGIHALQFIYKAVA